MSLKGLEIRVYFAGFQNSKIDQGRLKLLSLRMLQVTSGGLSYWGKAGTDIPEWAEDVDTLCPKSRKTLLTEQISEHWSVQCKCKLEKHRNTDWPSCLCYAAASCPQFMYDVNTYLEPPFHVPGMNFTSSINLQHKHSVAIFLLENRNVTLVFPTSTAFPSVTCHFSPDARLTEFQSYWMCSFTAQCCFPESWSRVISLCSTQDELLSLLGLTARISRNKGAMKSFSWKILRASSWGDSELVGLI